MKCANCQNCIVTKQGRVTCRAKLWEKDRGGIFEYRSLCHFLNYGGQDSQRANPDQCHQYNDMGRISNPMRYNSGIVHRTAHKFETDRILYRAYWLKIHGYTWRAIAKRFGYKSKSSRNFTRAFPELITQRRDNAKATS